MQREEMTRIRRELGLDLAEAGRKAGLTASSQPSGRMNPGADGCEASESSGAVLQGFQEIQSIGRTCSYQVSAIVP